MAKTYGVTVPIAGHAYIEIVADTEDDAIDEALSQISNEHLESWEALKEIVRGNVCSAPSPWSAEAVVLQDDGKDDEPAK